MNFGPSLIHFVRLITEQRRNKNNHMLPHNIRYQHMDILDFQCFVYECTESNFV